MIAQFLLRRTRDDIATNDDTVINDDIAASNENAATVAPPPDREPENGSQLSGHHYRSSSVALGLFTANGTIHELF